MKLPLTRAFISLVVLVPQAICAVQNAQLHHSADSLQSIDTGGDRELQAWLESNIRVPSDVLDPCPQDCSRTLNSTTDGGWYLFSGSDKLAACNKTMLSDLVIDSGKQAGIRACIADYTAHTTKAYVAAGDVAALCPTRNNQLVQTSIQMSRHDSQGAKFSTSHAVDAIQQLSRYVSSQPPSCESNVISFAYSQSVVVGIYSGLELHQHGLTTQVLDKLVEFVQDTHLSTPIILQLCPSSSLGADYTLGIVVFGSAHFDEARNAVESWSKGDCNLVTSGSDWMTAEVRMPKPVTTNSTSAGDTKSNATSSTSGRQQSSKLQSRAECKTTQVKSGDGCWALADRCKISQDKLKQYNPDKNFCNTLAAGQQVCCSSGTLPSSIPPSNSDGSCKTKAVQSGDDCGSLASKCGLTPNDFMKVNTKAGLCSSLAVGQSVCCSNGKLPDNRPKPNADGSCTSHRVEKDEGCSSIAVSRGLTVQDLNDFNKNTWGWNGCDILYQGFRLCVSKGTPPMPEPVSNAVCGPTVPGTTRIQGVELADLNPCPLKACCNVWGQCGLTEDFCLVKASKTGAPGTSGLHNGCVSNCGIDIKKGAPPATKINIAYFEAWNGNRPCLRMDVDQIDTSKYTHVHFAFAEVTRDFQVNITAVQGQFEKFKAMSGVKKIISFGGWDFSALPATFNILREAVQPQNRDVFKKNVVDFVNQHNLDGVDLDWEYPGAPDIPDIPSDDPKNGVNYLKFLISLKGALDKSKTVSFAAPASYWYLKAYPIEIMARRIDYIVFMTYDLHGQWDYGNKWTSSGCSTGNCLRSHVNETETMNALAMITKAGVPSNKVVVGVASYGRSFKMAIAGCSDPHCKFTGSARQSNAYKGRCTQTGGYISNAEIFEIINSNRVTKQWKEEGSNLMVFDDTEWVSYMDDDVKASRSKTYDSFNFAGTTDWAVDLQKFQDGSGGDSGDDSESYIDTNLLPDCTVQDIPLLKLHLFPGAFPPHCLDMYMMQGVTRIARESLDKYKQLVDGGYDKKFRIYEKYVRDQVQPQIDSFMASDEVDKYFKCSEVGTWLCCNECIYNCERDRVCQKFKGCNSRNGTPLALDKCPQREEMYDFLDTQTVAQQITFHFKDKDGFYKAISKKFGIEESWISMRDRRMKNGNGCQYAGLDSKKCMEDSALKWHSYPTGDKINVYNPKEIFGKSYEKAKDIIGNMELIRDFADFDDTLLWPDAVDAVALPAFSLQMAIESMEKIIDKAKEIKKHEREEFILNMIFGILFFVPFVGEAGLAGSTAARSMLRLIEGVGDAALTVYGIVENPKDAFGAIFGFLLGNAGISNKALRSAAEKKRTFRSDDFKAAESVKLNLDSIDRIRPAVLDDCSIIQSTISPNKSHENKEIGLSNLVSVIDEHSEALNGYVTDPNRYPNNAAGLKTTKDGEYVLIPQPSSSPDDPLNWPRSKKWKIVAIIAYIAFLADYTGGTAIITVIPQSIQWNESQATAQRAVVGNLFTIGACGIVVVSLARYFGRLPVTLIFQLVMFGTCIWSAAATSFKSYLAARIINGFFCSVGQGGALMWIKDLFFFHEHPRIINYVELSIILSPYLGPLIASFIVAETTCRWAFWLCTILPGIGIVLVFFLDETNYERDKTQQPRGSYINPLLGIQQAKYWQYRSLVGCLVRPAIAITKIPVFLVLVYYFFNFARVIGVNTTIAIWLTNQYGFTGEGLGYFYFFGVVGVGLGWFAGHFLHDTIGRYHASRHNGRLNPEARLIILYPATSLLCISLVLLGLAFEFEWHYMAIAVFAAMQCFGVMIVTTAINAYLLDCYPEGSGEVSAWVTASRNWAGFISTYIQIEWVNRSGPARTLGAQAGITLASMVLIVVLQK